MPAGVVADVVTVNVIVELLVPLGKKVGVKVVPPVIGISVAEVKFQVAPAGVVVQANVILSATGAAAPVSPSVIV